MQNSVFLVWGESGAYDTHAEWIAGTFRDRITAERFAADLGKGLIPDKREQCVFPPAHEKIRYSVEELEIDG